MKETAKLTLLLMVVLIIFLSLLTFINTMTIERQETQLRAIKVIAYNNVDADPEWWTIIDISNNKDIR